VQFGGGVKIAHGNGFGQRFSQICRALEQDAKKSVSVFRESPLQL
jgi:hypothetical protein